MKGQILNGLEDSVWNYYDENGKLVQYGSYDRGIQVGSWVYDFPSLDTSVTWKPRFDILRKFTFSLPEVFEESDLDFDTLTYTAIDQAHHDVFTIRDFGITSDLESQNYFQNAKEGFAIDYDLLSASSMEIKTSKDSYLFDRFFIKNKENGIEVMHFNLYRVVKHNIIFLSYTCSARDSVKGKFFIGEIFYHTFYNQNRIIEPFAEIKELINRY